MPTGDEIVAEFGKELLSIRALYKEDTVMAGMIVTLAEIIAAHELPEAYLGFVVTNLVAEVNKRRVPDGQKSKTC